MSKYSAETLTALDRKELQQIAKGLGLKQNAKSADLISQILAKQPSTPAKVPTPAKSSATPTAAFPAPATAAKSATPKAASAKKVAKQPKPTKRDASPAGQSAQKSSKRQRREESPVVAAVKNATPKSSVKKTPKSSAKKTPKAASATKSASPKTKASPKAKATPSAKASSSKKSASKSVKKGGIAKAKTPGKKTRVTGITEDALELLTMAAK
jgi:hypothetical protein